MLKLGQKELRLVGYADRLSVQPEETIKFMVSSDYAEYQMDVVRLIHGDPNPNGPGFKEEIVETPISGKYPGRIQTLDAGSYGIVPDNPALQLRGSFTLYAWIYPTLIEKGTQGILTKWSPQQDTGYGLFIDEGGSIALKIGSRKHGVIRISASNRLQNMQWYFVAASYEADTGAILVYQQPLQGWPHWSEAANKQAAAATAALEVNDLPLLIAADWHTDEAGNHFSGKLDSPGIIAQALQLNEMEVLSQGMQSQHYEHAVIAAWDFSANVSSKIIHDTSRNGLHGTTVNMPMRGATGRNWSGRQNDFQNAPHEYGAIHFHDDDLEDACWQPDAEFTIPLFMKSGIYAARLRADNEEWYIAFFVRPRKGTTNARIAYLLPTFTYLAYANMKSGCSSLLSLYDYHRDGTGVCYASRFRPLLDLNPKHLKFLSEDGNTYTRHLCADLSLIDWMESKHFSYDIITDDDLHAEGATLLKPYSVILTGSHPEYYSEAMLNGLQEYLQDGGRLMYLGGNGFYWVTSMSSEHPYAIEIRRWGGTETWVAAPGEYHHSTTGELGGLWRHRGKPPQALVGVGFCADGWLDGPELNCAPARPYKRNPDSLNPKVSFIFEGIQEEELIGDFESLGLGRGAAGDEVDRVEPALGSPGHTLCLATATGFVNYTHAVEERHHSGRLCAENPCVKADLAYLEYPNGGAVFSAGSITWCSSLSFQNYNNNVSKITENVLRKFQDK